MDSSNPREGGKGKKGKKSKKEKNSVKEEEIVEEPTTQEAGGVSPPLAEQEATAANGSEQPEAAPSSADAHPQQTEATTVAPTETAAVPKDGEPEAKAADETTYPEPAASASSQPSAEEKDQPIATDQRDGTPKESQPNRSEVDGQEPEPIDDASRTPNPKNKDDAAVAKEQSVSESKPQSQDQTQASSSPGTTGKIRTREKKGKQSGNSSSATAAAVAEPSLTAKEESAAVKAEEKVETAGASGSQPASEQEKHQPVRSQELEHPPPDPSKQEAAKPEPEVPHSQRVEPTPKEQAGAAGGKNDVAKAPAPTPEATQQKQLTPTDGKQTTAKGEVSPPSAAAHQPAPSAATSDSQSKLIYEPVPEVHSEGEENEGEGTKAKTDGSGGKKHVRTNEPIEPEGEQAEGTPMTVKERRRARKVVTQLADHDPFARGSVKISGGGQGVGIAVVREVRRNRRSTNAAAETKPDSDGTKDSEEKKKSPADSKEEESKKQKSSASVPTSPSTEPIAAAKTKGTPTADTEPKKETPSTEPINAENPSKTKTIELETKEIQLRVGDVLQIRWYSPEVGSIVECDRFYKPLKARSAACLLPMFRRRDRHEKDENETDKKVSTPPLSEGATDTTGQSVVVVGGDDSSCGVEKEETKGQPETEPNVDNAAFPSAEKKQTADAAGVATTDSSANEKIRGATPTSKAVTPTNAGNGSDIQQHNDSTTATHPHGGEGEDEEEEERFTVKFPEKGEYFFRSEDPELEGFRLKVKVSGLTHDFFRNTFKYLIGGSLILTLIVIAILAAVFVVDANVKILPRSGRAGDPSYEGAKEVQTILLRYLGSWCVLGVLILLILVFVRLGFCCWRSWCQDFGRGFSSYQQRKAQISQLVLLLPLCGVVLTYWWYFLKTNFYWNTFFRTLRVSTVNTINQVIGLTEDLEFISVQFPILFEDAFDFPPGVPTLLTQVQTLADDVKTFASGGEDLIRALFRAFVILVFVVLQIVLASVSYKLVATLKRNANLLRSGIWMMWFSLFCVCLSLGTGWIVYEVLDRAVDILGEFQGKTMTAESLQRATASSADSPIMKVFGMCLGKADFDLDFMNKALDGLKQRWNEKAALAGIPNLVIPANIGDYTKKLTGGLLNGTNSTGGGGGGSGGSFSGLGNTSVQNLTIDVLLNYSDVLVNQVDAMAPMFERSKISLNSTLSSFGISLGNSSALSSIQRLAPDFSRIGPTLKAAASVAKGLRGVMDCSLIRETLADSYLVLKHSIVENIFIANILLIVIFGFHVFSIFLGFGTIYVFNRKWKNWYEARSNRWFRFRSSYQAHIRLLDQMDPEEVGERVRWYRPFTLYDCLNGFYSVNMSNAFLVMLQAVLLILLHQSAEEDRLSFELQLVCFLCAASPLVAFVTELVKWIGVRALLRFITFGLTTTGCVFASMFAAESIKKNIHCISAITGGVGKSSSTSANSTGFSLPFTGDCGADSSVRQIEQSVYSVLIAIVCFIASITSLVLLFGVRIRQTNAKIQTAAEKKNNNCGRYCANGTIGLFFLLVLAGLIVLVVFVVTNVVPAPRPPRTSINPITNDLRFCNGYPHYCSKTPLDIVWMMPHHSFSNADDGFFSPYHFLGTSTQLGEGIRAFDLSVFPTPADKGATLSICRSNCDLGSYPLLRELTQLYNYMTLNTSTVMLIRFRFQSDSALPTFVSAMSQANLTQFVWKGKLNGSPVTNTSFVWPNLRKLLETNQRIILFTDLSTESVLASTSAAVRGSVSWLLPVWEYAFETEERVKKVEDFNCELQSMSFDPAAVVAPQAIRDNQLAFLHHSISVPEASAGASAITNARDSIISRFFNCSASWNRRPSIVVLNYWSVGNPIVTIDEING